MNIRKPAILFFLFSLFAIATRAQVVYDANAQVRAVGYFNAIHISGSIDLYLSNGNEDVVAVSGRDAQVIASITTEVKNGELFIGMRSNHSNASEGAKAYVSARTLNKLSASGASDIFVNGKLVVSDLAISISGASDFKGEVQAQNLRLNASGSSDFFISGRTGNLKIELSGSSDVKGFGLVSEYCDIQGSGASDVRITVNKEIKASLSGACDVAYRGAAAVREIKTSGSSSLKKMGESEKD